MALQDNKAIYTLNDGNTIPAVGFGSMSTSKDAVLNSLKAGYRLLDTAAIYQNEGEVGQAIRESGIPRDQIFITTKLWNTSHHKAEEALDISLSKLGTDYVDLYLIHWPSAEVEGPEFRQRDDWDFVDTWKELERIKRTTGKIKSIGVSNFTVKHFERLFADPDVKEVPVVNQIEAHPLLTQPKLMAYMQSKNIRAMAYAALGSADNFLMGLEEIQAIAQRNSVEPAQVLVSWAVQRGTVVIPRSSSEKRIRSNLQTLTLSQADFDTLSSLSAKLGAKRNNDVWRFVPEDEEGL